MKVIKVTGAIIQEKNRFLICRRGPDEKAAGLWEFPGGKLEINETLEDCVLRELKEELDIDAEIHSLYDNYRFKSKDIIYSISEGDEKYGLLDLIKKTCDYKTCPNIFHLKTEIADKIITENKYCF